MTDSGITDASSGGTKSNAQLVYILYLVSLLVGVTAIVGVIMAYVSKDGAPDWLKTHYSFMVRTFWIGLLYSVVGVVLCIVVVGFFILLFALIWWIVRCVQGLDYLGKNQPIPKPDSWMFAT